MLQTKTAIPKQPGPKRLRPNRPDRKVLFWYTYTL